MHPYYALMMPKSAAAPAPAVPPTLDASATKFSPSPFGQATASFTLNSDGSCTSVQRGGPGSWITPVGGSYGGSYWAKVDITSGAVTSGTTGSRVAIGSGVTWSVTTTGSEVLRSAEAIGTIEIWDAAAAGNLKASGTFNLYAEVDNS